MSNPAPLCAPEPSPREPNPGERLWTLTKNGKWVEAESREHGEWDVECQIVYEGKLAYGRFWRTREAASAAADAKLREP
jgi:hypothetical protein